MAEKKKCSCGCGKNAIKEGLAWGCYSKKFGKPPYGHGGTKKTPAKVKPVKAVKETKERSDGYVETADEVFLRKIGMTQMADGIKMLRAMAQAARQIIKL